MITRKHIFLTIKIDKCQMGYKYNLFMGFENFFSTFGVKTEITTLLISPKIT